MAEQYRATGDVHREYDADEFMEYYSDVVAIYQRAFTGRPWFEDLSDEELAVFANAI